MFVSIPDLNGVGIVDDPVQDSIRNGCLRELAVPACRGELRTEDGGYVRREYGIARFRPIIPSWPNKNNLNFFLKNIHNRLTGISIHS